MAYVDFTTTGHDILGDLALYGRPRPSSESASRWQPTGLRGLAIERLTAAYRAARHSMLVTST